MFTSGVLIKYPPQNALCAGKSSFVVKCRSSHVDHISCAQKDEVAQDEEVAQKEEKVEVDLLKRMIQVHDTTKEEILRVRICVDEWIASRQPDKQSPLRRVRDVLDRYQQLTQKSFYDHRKIKTLQKCARQSEKAAPQKQVKAAITEQALRSQITEQQVQIDQLRAELDKQSRKKAYTKKPTKPLPVPNAPVVISNPLP